MRLMLVVSAVFLGVLVGPGCRKRSEPQVHTTASGGSSDGTDRPAKSGGDGVEGPGAREGSGGAVDGQEALVDPREAAIERAVQSLIHGSESAAAEVKALGADTMVALKFAIESENVLALTGALPVLAELDAPEAGPMIAAAIGNSAGSVRMAALNASAAGRHRIALEKILPLAKDPEYEVRATLCDTLDTYKARDDAAVAVLFDLLSDEEDVVRAACGTAFGRLATLSVWLPKLSVLLDQPKAAPREGGVRALGEIHTPEVFDMIRGRLADSDPSVAATAVSALSRYGDEAAAREIEPFLRDERRTVRVEAAAALFRLPRDTVRNWVYETLKDREPAVRVEGAAALERYPDDPETFIRLHALLRDEESAVRESVAMALEALHDGRSVTALLARLADDPDDGVRKRLVLALAAADSARAVPHLIDRMKVAKSGEMMAILESLGTITGQELGTSHAAWKAWYDASGAVAPIPDPAKPPTPP